MSRLQSVRENWTEITNRLMQNKQELAQFLRFSAGMYKQSFPDAALIYQQNPNATKVAVLDTWNKLGRLVNRGEHSIAVFGDDDKCRYLFDISQTNGKKIPELWHLDEDLSSELTAVINKKYGKGCKNIQEAIAAMSIDNTRSHLTEMMSAIEKLNIKDSDIKTYQQSFVSAVRFVVSNRCDSSIAGGINLKAVDLFKDNKDLIRFCDLVQKSAKDTLLEIEREIAQIRKKRRDKEHGLQTDTNRAVQSRTDVHGRPEGSGTPENSHRQMGQNVAGVGENGVPDRGIRSDNGGAVANHTEGNRQRSREPLSGTGRTVPSEKSPSADVRGNTDMGENTSADNRTSDNVGGSLSVEGLIERYKNADFNRRLDSYEIAGYMLYEAQTNEWKGGAIDYFNRFEADRYSAAQGDEIRGIIENALKSREMAQENRQESAETVEDISEPVINTEETIFEPAESDVYISYNEILSNHDLPILPAPLIEGIIKSDRFLKAKREQIAEYFETTQDMQKRSAFIKSVYNNDFTELDVGDTRVGYKSSEDGLLMWEGHFLGRTREVGYSWDMVQAAVADMLERGVYLSDGKVIDRRTVAECAEELEAGDKIRFQGEVWTVKSASAYMLSMENDSGEKKKIYNTGTEKWYDEIDKVGFEYISEDEIDEPVFVEPEVEELSEIDPEPEISEKVETAEQSETAVEPVGDDGQLSFFGEVDTPVKPVKKSNRPKAVSHTAPTVEMINHVLRSGSDDPYSLERIVAHYQKGKSLAENADFLRQEYGTCGKGLVYYGDSAHNLSAWFDKDGMTIAISNTAFPEGRKAHLNWEQVSEHISDMLEKGNYCSQDVIDRAAGYELETLAGKLWYIHQDYDKEYNTIPYFISEDMFKGGFPDSTARIAAAMTDGNTLQTYIDGLEELISRYEQDRNTMRFHFHEPRKTLQQLKDLQAERIDFIAQTDFKYSPKFFITEDEKDAVVARNGGYENGKFDIAAYFEGEHTQKEKAAFLKNIFGWSGSYYGNIGISYDGKGLKYTKGDLSNPDTQVLMNWNEVTKRIDNLIAEDRYITQNDIDERIKGAKRVIFRYKPDNELDKRRIEEAKKILDEYGIKYEGQTEQQTADEKSSLEKILQKAQDAGIPVEEVSDIPEKDAAVYMDISSETFIAVEQVDEGISYSVYDGDLTLVDGGVWEMNEGMDLKTAAAELLAVFENVLGEYPDYDSFLELVDTLPEDFGEKLAKMKSDIYSDMNAEKITRTAYETEEKAAEKSDDTPAVNAPEKITPVQNVPKSGIPVEYHFSAENVVTGGAKSRYRANIEAIKTLRKVEAENRYATPEEQAVMAKYVGWGGIQQAFMTDRAADNIGGNLGEAAPSGWENEQRELRELLTDEEYEAARASTLTSFYTPPEVTDGIYQALKQFGFEGGNVLEPSMGVGNFFSKMPEDMRGNSRLYGVEIDSISGRLAQQLYPNDRIQIKGFEKTNFNNNSFDVVLGNIPFGDYSVSDKNYDKYNFKIHDYFAAKAVDKVKPNGVVALVTSKFTMDKLNEKARRYLAERCDLLGAVRLPAGTFKDADSVTTDILFLKKRETLTVEVPDWVHFGETPDGIPCNQYFVDNPDMVLGRMDWDKRMKGKYGDDSRVTTCYPNEGVSLSEQLEKAISKIQGKIETVKEKTQDSNTEVIPADPSVRNFTHTIVDGKLFFRENEVMIKVQQTGKTLDRMMGMHKIRQATMAVIDAQAAGCPDKELKKLQAELNFVYDKFVRTYGYITDTANERCFKQDDDYNTLAALEIVDVEEETVEKAEIFTKRTIQPVIEIVSVDTPQEALQVSLDRIGRVDIAYMAKLAGCTPEKLIADLGDDIFRNPAKIKDDDPLSGYEDASEYLSGNVREKLKIVKDYAKHIDSSFERNVAALEKVLPKNLEAGEISVRIGANWIDVEDYNRFFREYAKGDTFSHPITRTRMGEYKIEGKSQDRSVAAYGIYGTSRMSSYQIFENLLNQRDIVVRDRETDFDGKVTYVVNPKETQLAKEKARQMKEAFKSWVWEDIDRREKYVEKYNYLFNAIRGREYDGSHQSFPNMNPAIELRPHQKNAILRGKLNGNTLLAHCVGAGKSATRS